MKYLFYYLVVNQKKVIVLLKIDISDHSCREVI